MTVKAETQGHWLQCLSPCYRPQFLTQTLQTLCTYHWWSLLEAISSLARWAEGYDPKRSNLKIIERLLSPKPIKIEPKYVLPTYRNLYMTFNLALWPWKQKVKVIDQTCTNHNLFSGYTLWDNVALTYDVCRQLRIKIWPWPWPLLTWNL